MPGFSSDEQMRLSHLVLAHRRSLKKIFPMIEGTVALPALAALRLAVLFYRGRSSITLPKVEARCQSRKVKLTIEGDWLVRNPLTATALRDEIREWEKIGIDLRVSGLDAVDAEAFAAD
jgi:exopolyphosphatase/guanosine-5'-triphosphate,3'-diphosphate pyrophosphatase